MELRDFFIDGEGRLRSGGRAAFFFAAFLVCTIVFEAAAVMFVTSVAGRARSGTWVTASLFLTVGIVRLGTAIFVGGVCGAVFEGLRFRALGWGLHRGWLKDVALGSLIGAASLLLASGIAAAPGGIRFSFNSSSATTLAKTALVTLLVFVIAGAAEEAIFRGYPLQTFARAKLAWVGVLVTSFGFAVGHLSNPNVSKGLPFINTALAGVWLAVGYLRTRRLWFPLGLHWAWNWTQASLLGIPVSGSQRVAPAPLLHAMNVGPDWLTGGAYGLEGGIACSAALVISTIVVWRTKLVSATEVDSPNVAQVASGESSQ